MLADAYNQEYYGTDKKKFIGPIASLVGQFQQGRAKLVSQYLAPPQSILDIGCGNGGFLQQMLQRGYSVTGTELSPDSADRVDTELRPHVYIGDLLNIDWQDRRYDAISLWHVFEHLSQPFRTLEKIYDLLKPGGYAFFSMPNHESTQAQNFGPHWFHLDPPRHLFGFGPNSFTKLLKQTNFTVKKTSTWSFEQNPYGQIQSQLNINNPQRDRAYRSIKGDPSLARHTRFADYAKVALLTPYALIKSAIESYHNRGATFTLVAQKNHPENHSE